MFFAGNGATNFFLILVLIACMAGLASCFSGIHHLRVWRSESLAGAGTAALIAWLLTLLAFGYVAPPTEHHQTHDKTYKLFFPEHHVTPTGMMQFVYKRCWSALFFLSSFAQTGLQGNSSGSSSLSKTGRLSCWDQSFCIHGQRLKVDSLSRLCLQKMLQEEIDH